MSSVDTIFERDVTELVSSAKLIAHERLPINQESLGGLTNRGITYYKLKNKEKACADWQHAIRSDYQPARIYFNKFCQ